MSQVTATEALSIQVGRWLQKNGYDLCVSIGSVKISSLYATDALGLVSRTKYEEKRGGLFSKRRRYPLQIGTIWFSNRLRGAAEDRWVFEVLGREFMDELKGLSDRLISEFEVGIGLRLINEEPRIVAPASLP